MENKQTLTPPKDEAIFPIKVNAKPNIKYATELAQRIMVKLTEKKEMESKHTPKLPLRISEKNECSICDSDGNFIIETFETETAEFIVTACNNYQALKEENEELKRLLGQILKLDIQEDYYKMHIVEPITDLLTKHTK